MVRRFALVKSNVFILAVVILFISFFRLGSVTLFDVDEAVFAEATKEMVESGNWITPTYNGENRYDKPILFYWLMAVSYKIFGINEFAARFPSAFSGLLLCIAVFIFVKHFYDEKHAIYAVTSLALSICFFVYSHAAVTDMALTLFITIALFSFYLSIKEDKRYIYGFSLFSAFAFLTKGLIGVVFPFGIAFIYLLITKELKGIRKVFSLKATILFLIISSPWYIAQSLINGQEFVQQFFIKHHFMRYTGVISGHKGPIYYYIPVLIIGLFPWIAFLPAGIRNIFREKKDLHLFAFIWFAFIVLFFSFSTTKLPNYILPAIPPVTLLIASGLSEQNIQWRKYTNLFIAAISLMIGVSFIISKKYLLTFGIYDIDWIPALAAVLFLMTILSLYAVFANKTIHIFTSCITFLFLFMISIKILPVVNQYLQGTLYKYSLYAKERLQDDEKIIAYSINNPSIVFYSGHKVANARNKKELMSCMEADKRQIAIAKVKDIEMLEDLGFNVLEKEKTYAILENK